MQEIKVVNLTEPIRSVGREYQGPYEFTTEYLGEVQLLLEQNELPYSGMTVLSAYFDDPEETASSELKSYHGFQVDESLNPEEPLQNFELKGMYLHTSINDDPAANLPIAYQKLMSFAADRNLKVEKNAGTHRTEFSPEGFRIEIYMKVLS